MVWIITIVILTVADQLIKNIIRTTLPGSDSITVIENFFYLVHRHNTGAAWSFLADASWGIIVLSILSGLASAVLVVVTLKITALQYKLPLSLMSAGAIGNFIDRVRLKSVTDYLDFHFGSYIFPTFNLADICLVVGTILFSYFILFSTETPDDHVNLRGKYLS